MITFPCPRCSNALHADRPLSGETIRCPACGEEALVPDSADASGGEGPSPAGYQILFELGRSGTSVVHAARSRAMGRVVALKMIRGGADEFARLRAQTEATRVQHPGIAQLYEVGEHDGRYYLVLEYCSEGSLDRKLGGTPLPPKDAAALVSRLAEAVQAAHDARVVHGDLKPGNVLLAEDGTPKITGFGQTGGKGTPSYLAPEQAEGKEVGPAADVYALGAILYECLTGRPPFRAATAADTLAQVAGNEPVPLRFLNAAVPRELESVALKCLEKQPAKRFASAKQLGDELGRFAAGGPITPADSGAPGGMTWLRRNPAAVALAVLLLVALIGGAAVAARFALDARAQSDRARQAEQQADQAGKRADENARTAQDTAKKLKDAEHKATEDDKRAKQRQQEHAAALEALEDSLAASLLRPVGHSAPRFDRRGRNAAPLDSMETGTFLQVGGARSDRLRLRLIETALEDARAAERAARRPEWLVQSAVGLDRRRRQEAEALVLRARTAKAPEQALASVRLGQELNVQDTRGAKQAGASIVSAMTPTTDARALNALAQSLKVLNEPLTREDAFAHSTRAAEILVAAMSKTTDAAALNDLALGLAAVTERLPARLAAGHAGKAAAVLVAGLGKATTPAARQSLVSALATLSERLNEKEAAAAADAIVTAASRSTDPHNVGFLARSLKSVSEPLEDEAASEHAGKAAESVVFVLSKTKDPAALAALSQGLKALAERLDAKESARLAAALVASAAKVTDPHALGSLAQGWKTASERLDARPEEAAKLADALVAAMNKSTDPAALRSLALGLKAVGERLDDKEGAKAAEAIVGLLTKAVDADAMSALAQGLEAVGGRLDAAQSSKAVKAIVEVMLASKRGGESDSLALGLKAVSGRLEAADANRSAESISVTLAEVTNAGVLDARSQALRALCRRLDARQSSAHAARAAAAVVAFLEKDSDSDAYSLAQALEAVAGWLDAKQAGGAAAAVAAAMSKTTNANALASLAQALDVVGERLGAKESAKHAGKAAEAIVAALTRAGQPDALHILAQALELVSRRLDGQSSALAAKSAAAVVVVLGRSSDADTLHSSGQALKVLGRRLDAGESGKAAAALVEALGRTTEPYALESLAQALGAVGGLEAGEARKALEAIVVLLAQATDQTAAPLAQALGAAGASRSTGEVVGVLSHPLCAGPAQRALLGVLGARCKREFRSAWHFLDWAEANGVEYGAAKAARQAGSPPTQRINRSIA